MDPTYHRNGDTREQATRRGAELYSKIYDNIPGYDSSKTLHASPDYYHIVRGTKSYTICRLFYSVCILCAGIH